MRDFVQTGCAVLLAALALPLLAQAPAAPARAVQVGDRGAVVVEPALARPPVKPCSVALFTDLRFDAHGDPTAMTAEPHPWHYAPPAACPGPWSKVVLEADFAVTAGRQFDRTASLWLDGVNIYYGTTQEPSAKVAPRWHVERDLTDYAPLFVQAGEGDAILNNWVDGKYTGVITGSARLVFYPAVPGVALPTVADRVYGLVGAGHGAPTPVQDDKQSLSRTLTLPRNVERAWLDVIAQSQSTDEQWYMCIDDADIGPSKDYALGPPSSGYPLQQCGNGNFRAAEVSIDGQPAARVPIYPWTYTGGIDPNLWRPITDLQTLNFAMYRVDLTPFAALLDNGKPHTVAVRVIGAHHFFSLAANLLLQLDRGSKALAGKLLQNTLAGDRARLDPRVTRQWQADGTGGEVDTMQHGDYVITGELATSHGVVRTRVAQQSSYTNRQHFAHPDAATYQQVFDLNTKVVDTTTRTLDDKSTEHQRTLDYPMRVDVTKHMHADGSFTSEIGVRQGYAKRLDEHADGKPASWSALDDALVTHATTDWNAGGTGITGSRDQHSEQTWRYRDSLGSCYALKVGTRDQAVDAVTAGEGCPGGANRLDWRAWPYAM